MEILGILESGFDVFMNPTVATFALGYVFGASSWAWKQEMIDNLVKLGKYAKRAITKKPEEKEK